MDITPDIPRTDGPPSDASAPAEVELRAAAVVLGISSEALRKRIARGTIPGRKVAGVWMVTLDPDTVGRTDVRTRSDNGLGYPSVRPRPSAPTVDLSDYARAQERITGLEAQLSQAQADRDRWHDLATSAQETYLRDMAAMRELVAREQAIALRATTRPDGWTDDARTDNDASTDGQNAAVREAGEVHDSPTGNHDSDKLSADMLALSWRRWWRRITRSG